MSVALPTNLSIYDVTYSNVTLLSKTPATLTIRHSSGIGIFPMTSLDLELQAKLGFDAQKAAAFSRQRAELAQAAAEAGTDQRVAEVLAKGLREYVARIEVSSDTGVAIGNFYVRAFPPDLTPASFAASLLGILEGIS